MKRQNPPQASLDQALTFERFLNPVQLGVAYAVLAIAGFIFVTILFAVLASSSLVSSTRATTVVFAMLALSPAVLALIEFQRRPDDLLSVLIRSAAESRRKPLSVTADRCTFKVLLRSGETLCVNLGFYYPAKYHVSQVQERVISRARLALELYASLRNEPPTDNEVQDTLDQALESVASEFDIPVLYSEIRDQHRIRDAYSQPDDALTPYEYLGLATGTLG